MRGAFVLASAAAMGCAPMAEAPIALAPEIVATVQVSMLAGGRTVARVHEGPPVSRIVGLRPGESLAILGFDRPLSDLGVAVQDGQVLLSEASDARAFPLPSAWLEVDGDRLEPVPVSADAFDARFPELRVPRQRECPRFKRVTTPRITLEARDLISMMAPFGEDRVVIGMSRKNEGAVTLGHPYVAAYSPGGEVRATITATTYEPRGFGLPGEAEVWFSYYDAATGVPPAAPRWCRWRGTDAQPACAAMEFAGDVPVPFAPMSIAGQRVDGRVEAMALNWDARLYHWREGEPWRELVKVGQYPYEGCNVGIQSLMLTFTGPGRALVGFPSGPILEVEAVDGGPATTRAFYQPGERFCRNFYGRFPTGGELIGTLGLGQDSLTRLFQLSWRPTPDTLWSPIGEGALARAATLVGSALALKNGPDSVTFLETDPHRPDQPPHVCPLVTTPGPPDVIVPLAGGLVAMAGQSLTDVWYLTFVELE